MRVSLCALILIFMLFEKGIASGLFGGIINYASGKKSRAQGELVGGTPRLQKPKGRPKKQNSLMNDALDLHEGRPVVQESSHEPDLDLHLGLAGQSHVDTRLNMGTSASYTGWNQQIPHQQQMYGQPYSDDAYNAMLNAHHGRSAYPPPQYVDNTSGSNRRNKNVNSQTSNNPTQPGTLERREQLRQIAKSIGKLKASQRQKQDEYNQQAYQQDVSNVLQRYSDDPHNPHFPPYPGHYGGGSGSGSGSYY